MSCCCQLNHAQLLSIWQGVITGLHELLNSAAAGPASPLPSSADADAKQSSTASQQSGVDSRISALWKSALERAAKLASSFEASRPVSNAAVPTPALPPNVKPFLLASINQPAPSGGSGLLSSSSSTRPRPPVPLVPPIRVQYTPHGMCSYRAPGPVTYEMTSLMCLNELPALSTQLDWLRQIVVLKDPLRCPTYTIKQESLPPVASQVAAVPIVLFGDDATITVTIGEYHSEMMMEARPDHNPSPCHFFVVPAKGVGSSPNSTTYIAQYLAEHDPMYRRLVWDVFNREVPLSSPYLSNRAELASDVRYDPLYGGAGEPGELTRIYRPYQYAHQSLLTRVVTEQTALGSILYLPVYEARVWYGGGKGTKYPALGVGGDERIFTGRVFFVSRVQIMTATAGRASPDGRGGGGLGEQKSQPVVCATGSLHVAAASDGVIPDRALSPEVCTELNIFWSGPTYVPSPGEKQPTKTRKSDQLPVLFPPIVHPSSQNRAEWTVAILDAGLPINARPRVTLSALPLLTSENEAVATTTKQLLSILRGLSSVDSIPHPVLAIVVEYAIADVGITIGTGQPTQTPTSAAAGTGTPAASTTRKNSSSYSGLHFFEITSSSSVPALTTATDNGGGASSAAAATQNHIAVFDVLIDGCAFQDVTRLQIFPLSMFASPPHSSLPLTSHVR